MLFLGLRCFSGERLSLGIAGIRPSMYWRIIAAEMIWRQSAVGWGLFSGMSWTWLSLFLRPSLCWQGTALSYTLSASLGTEGSPVKSAVARFAWLLSKSISMYDYGMRQTDLRQNASTRDLYAPFAGTICSADVSRVGPEVSVRAV
jgi:hypothetical protein